jgi:hypothetical protein
MQVITSEAELRGTKSRPKRSFGVQKNKIMTRNLAIFLGITLFFTNCSTNIDQTLLGDLTSAGTQLEDLIGQTSTSGEKLAKFQTVLDVAPAALKTDTRYENPPRGHDAGLSIGKTQNGRCKIGI